MGAQHLCVLGVGLAPHAAEEFAVRQQAAAVVNQRAEQFKFLWRQVNLGARD